eukprot:g1293.t1
MMRVASTTFARGVRARAALASRALATSTGGRLEGKTVVVCGAGNDEGEAFGIGKMTAVVCAREGANVVAVSNNAAHADGTAEAIRTDDSGSRSALAVTADCTNPDDVAALLAATVDAFGSVDSLINAGVYDAQPNGFKKLTPERWHRSMELNLHAQYYLVETFLPQMCAQPGGGSLVFVSTIAGTVGLGVGQQRHGYAAGKAGASALTKRIGVEYAKDGVRGNVVEAGYIASPLVTRAVEQAGADIGAVTATRDAYVPRGRQGEPVDVANACAFLASEGADFINGVTLPVDGGTSSVTYGP